jgi:biopolymer transport protein ExbD
MRIKLNCLACGHSMDLGDAYEDYLDGREVTEPALRAAVASARRGGRETRAVIAADRAAPHARVLELIDLLRAAGVGRFAVNIEATP